MDVKHSELPWKLGMYKQSVYCTTPKGDMKILDIRGWGHLTGGGSGALGLPVKEAEIIQDANAEFIVEAANSYYPDKAIIADLLEVAIEHLGWIEKSRYGAQLALASNAVIEAYKINWDRTNAVISKAQADLTHRSAIDDVKEAL